MNQTGSILYVLFLLGFLSTGCDATVPEGVRIISYTGPMITANAATGWTAELDDGLVTLSQIRTDDSTLVHKLILLDIGSSLPEFVGYAFFEPGNTRAWSTIDGSVAIQEFDINGEISGLLRMRVTKGPTHFGGTQTALFWINSGSSERQVPADSETQSATVAAPNGHMPISAK